MSRSVDPSSSSSQFLQTLQSDIDGEASESIGHDPVSELATLRDFNAKLLERISEIRRRNFELSKLEDKSRMRDNEVQQLRDQETKMRSALSKLTDESWAKDLEIQALKQGSEQEQKLRNAERAKVTEEVNTHHAVEIASLQEANAALSRQLLQLGRETEKLRDNLLSRDRELASVQKQNAEAATRIQLEIEEELHAHDQKFMTLKSSLEEKIEQLETEHAQEKSVFEVTTEDLQSKLRTLEYARSEQTRQLAQTSAVLMEFEKDLSETRAELSQTKKEAADLLRETLNTHSTQLSQEVAPRDAKIHQLESLLAERETSLEEARLREESLRQSHSSQVDQLKKAFEKRTAELESSHSSQIQNLTKNFEAQIHEAMQSTSELLQRAESSFEQTLREKNQIHAQAVDALKKHETDQSLELASLRTERSTLERRLAESNDRIFELRSNLDQQKNESRNELRTLRSEAEQALTELQARLKTQLQSEFREKFEVVLTENARLQSLLSVEDNSAEVERKELQKRQVQLNILEQKLRQSADVLQNDKSRILQLSKQLATELQQNRNHPGAHSQRQNEERSHELISIMKNLT